MDLSKKLSLMLLVLAVSACNEKVAPELKNSGVTNNGSGGTVQAPEEYFLKVTDESPVLLNYKLHRTGNGRFNSPCEVRSKDVALSNGLFTKEANDLPAIDHDSKNYDVTCYYDMEELGLFNNGFEFKIEASKNTCEYVAYSPYSFYDFMPGDSTAAISRIVCEEGVTSSDAVSVLTGIADATDDAGTVAGCGQVVESAINTTPPNNPNPKFNYLARTQNLARVRNDPGDIGLCNYDYSELELSNGDTGPNCDVGFITLKTYTVSLNTGNVGPPILLNEGPSVRKPCGGKASACIKGPHKDEFESQDWTRATWFNQTEKDKDFEKNYVYEDLLNRQANGSFYLTNFRSTLANPDLNFIKYNDDLVGDETVWTLNSNKKRFHPDVMEYYAANRLFESATQLISNAEYEAASTAGGFTHRPLAAEPFLGLTVGGTTKELKNNTDASDRLVKSYRTQPYYMVTCLDSAQDVKARIRIVVREWDRTFTSSVALENISDYLGLSTPNLVSRQDNPVDQEIPGHPGMYNNFNDLWDWDNFISMERTSVAPVIWFPTGGTSPTAHPNGFFNPENFTNGGF